jgi:uncharacterized membrane protein YphA (DoxX/SURF4 family)
LKGECVVVIDDKMVMFFATVVIMILGGSRCVIGLFTGASNLFFLYNAFLVVATFCVIAWKFREELQTLINLVKKRDS